MKLPSLLAKSPFVGNSEEELEVPCLLFVEMDQPVKGGQMRGNIKTSGAVRLPHGLWRDTGQITLPPKGGLGERGNRGLLLFVRLGEIFIQRSRDEWARKAGKWRGEEAWKKRMGHGQQE